MLFKRHTVFFNIGGPLRFGPSVWQRTFQPLFVRLDGSSFGDEIGVVLLRCWFKRRLGGVLIKQIFEGGEG